MDFWLELLRSGGGALSGAPSDCKGFGLPAVALLLLLFKARGVRGTRIASL